MSTAFDAFAESCRTAHAQIALVLGSGMGEVVERWGRRASVGFGDSPGLTAASIHGHRGQFSLVVLSGKPVIVQEGRLHFYEGHPWERVVQPVQLLAELGVSVVLHTNAAGGIHDALVPGSLMAIADHLEWTRPYCWRVEKMQSPYSPRLLDVLERVSHRCSIGLRRGLYASLTGPCYETPAEIRALKAWGADAVGMSTAREVVTGVECGMECAAVSCITNRAAGLSETLLSHEEVLAVAGTQISAVIGLVEGFVAETTTPQVQDTPSTCGVQSGRADSNR